MAMTGNAIVTGGAGDIGLAIGRKLRADGWRIGVLDRDAAAVARAVAEIPDAVGLVADVTDDASCAAAVEQFGPVDGLVNNAGIGRFGPLQDLSSADFRAVVEVNLVGPYVMAKACVRGMIERKRGVIVNITSVNALVPGPGAGGYPAAKAGLARLTEQMALEWGPLGIRANSVAPGFMATPMSVVNGVDEAETPDFQEWYVRRRKIPLGRTGLPEDVAGTIVFLASDYCRYMTGQLLVVDGGLTSTF